MAKKRRPAHETAHAAIRAKERYAIILTWSDLDSLEGRCAKAEGFIREHDGARHHAIVFNDQVLCVVTRQMRVVTVLPMKVASASMQRNRAEYQHHMDKRKTNSRRRGLRHYV